MPLLQTTPEIEYPESDGRPMGESGLHRRWMVRIFNLLEQRYRSQQVYISSDLLLYYEEGNPEQFVVPDVFLVNNSDPGLRNTYLLWEEGRPPNVVIEVTSRATRHMDQYRKPNVYAEIGVQELFLYDPTCHYLDPPLQGFRNSAGQFVPIEPDEHWRLASNELDVWFTRVGLDLVLIDRTTNQRLLTEAETERAEKEIQRIATDEARTARIAAEVAAEKLQRENDQLRQQIEQNKPNGE